MNERTHECMNKLMNALRNKHGREEEHNKCNAQDNVVIHTQQSGFVLVSHGHDSHYHFLGNKNCFPYSLVCLL